MQRAPPDEILDRLAHDLEAVVGEGDMGGAGGCGAHIFGILI
jgi:hypothetical protein